MSRVDKTMSIILGSLILVCKLRPLHIFIIQAIALGTSSKSILDILLYLNHVDECKLNIMLYLQ